MDGRSTSQRGVIFIFSFGSMSIAGPSPNIFCGAITPSSYQTLIGHYNTFTSSALLSPFQLSPGVGSLGTNDITGITIGGRFTFSNPYNGFINGLYLVAGKLKALERNRFSAEVSSLAGLAGIVT
jgi:hypothetical protein